MPLPWSRYTVISVCYRLIKFEVDQDDFVSVSVLHFTLKLHAKANPEPVNISSHEKHHLHQKPVRVKSFMKNKRNYYIKYTTYTTINHWKTDPRLVSTLTLIINRQKPCSLINSIIVKHKCVYIWDTNVKESAFIR